MGLYGDHVFPRVMDKAMDTPANRDIRRRVCERLAGDIVEIGFGTGHNLPFLPDTVRSVRAVDPLERGRRLAAGRLAATSVDVRFVGLDGQRLPLEDASADAVLCTWTLCSIPDAVAAVAEARRVLRPGGALHFVEHGRSPHAKVRRWQERMEPIQRRVACGCSLLKEIPELVEAGGLVVERLDTYYVERQPKIYGWTFEGVATKAA
jgi:ubiquinone/menaquinone biosynthesis C-methylase UbiE